jgi:hypothetical protein
MGRVYAVNRQMEEDFKKCGICGLNPARVFMVVQDETHTAKEHVCINCFVQVKAIARLRVLTLGEQEFEKIVTTGDQNANPFAAKKCKIMKEGRKREDLDEWWADLSPVEKIFLHEAGVLLKKAKPDETLELTNTGRSFCAKLVLNLKPPTRPGTRGGNRDLN